MKTLTTQHVMIAAVLLTTFAGALRLNELGNSGLWVDELISIFRVTDDGRVYNSRRFLGYVPIWLALEAQGVDLSVSKNDPWTWKAAGIDAWSARIGPAVVGIVSVPLLMLAAAPVIGRRAAILFGLLLAIAPWHLYWSQNARFYSLEFLFYNLALLIYYRATISDGAVARNARMALAMMLIVLAFMSHPTAIFIGGVLIGDYAIGLIRRKPIRIGVVGWIAAAAAGLYAIKTIYAFYSATQGWSTIRSQGNSYPPETIVKGFIYMTQPVVALLAAAGLWLGWREHKRLVILLALGAVVPVGLLVVASFSSYAHFRYSFVALGSWLLLAAFSLDRLYEATREKAGRIGAYTTIAVVVVPCLMMCLFYFSGGEGFRLRWDDAASYVQQHADTQDVIYFDYVLGGQYYMESEDVKVAHPEMDRIPPSPHPSWFVIMSQTASSTSPIEAMLDRDARLVAYFDTRIEEPYSSVKVYRAEPKPTATADVSPVPQP